METKTNVDSWLDAVAYFAIAGELAVKDWNDLDAF
jgi:hydroxyethylthiazole kinase-like sugar kinase family protein